MCQRARRTVRANWSEQSDRAQGAPKIYGADRIRYLRCRICRGEFSERKQTALWNTKVPKPKSIAVSEHLA